MLSDASMLMYPLPAFLTPLLHPATSDATSRYDRALADDAHVGLLIKRVIDTFEMVGAVVYGGREADDVAFAIRELHRDVGGSLDGKPYHPWSRELWAWNWAAITAAIMDVYGAIRGWPSNAFRDDAHLGMVEIGRRFGVLGMPESYPVFMVVWPVERDRVARTDSSAVRRVAASVTAAGMSPPPSLRALPFPLWIVLTWPVRHFYRISVCAAMTVEHRKALGLPTTRRDAIWLSLHRSLWRLVPRTWTHRLGVAYFGARLRWGTPSWRTRYPKSALSERPDS